MADTTNSGNYIWTITGPDTTQALIKVSGLNYTDPDDQSQIDFSDIFGISSDNLAIQYPALSRSSYSQRPIDIIGTPLFLNVWLQLNTMVQQKLPQHQLFN